MSRIECKAGDKVVLYRKDDCYPNLKVGEDIFTIVEGDLPFPAARREGDKFDYYYCLMATSLRYLRKTDKGANVVIVRNPQGEPLFHAFEDGAVVSITGEKTEYRGEYAYRAVDSQGMKQWILPSQFKLAKEQ